MNAQTHTPHPQTNHPAPASHPQTNPASHPPVTRREVQTALTRTFGFTEFRPHQEDIVRAVINRQDVFVVLPTGGGKSLCFQLPAHCMSGTCVVISPLIALMKDQVDKAHAKGIRAACLNSTQAADERRETTRILLEGGYDLLYVAPERFSQQAFQRQLRAVPISLFAIDEAHCISDWGHDFRPDYLDLARLVTDFPDIPIAAFTATATPRVQSDTIMRLGLRNPHVVRASFNRPNLYYEASPKQDVERQIADFIRNRADGDGIVYRTTRKHVEETAQFLGRAGIPALPYHAGLDRETRRENQDAFIKGDCRVIVATIAFGMGIDKPDVRFVIHGDLPRSVAGYYQETGRAGRDGRPAHCLLLFDRSDMARIHYFIDQIENPDEKKAAERRLSDMIAYACTRTCRRVWLLGYFGERAARRHCTGCDACRPDRAGHPDADGPGLPARGLSTTLEATLALARKGVNRIQIARRRNLAPTTIASHLEQLIRRGDVPVDPHVSPARRSYIERLFTQLGTTHTKPIVEAAQGKVSFEDARLVRAALQRESERVPS